MSERLRTEHPGVDQFGLDMNPPLAANLGFQIHQVLGESSVFVCLLWKPATTHGAVLGLH